MERPVKKILFALAVLSLAFPPAALWSQEPSAPKLAEQQYKNIKVLKGIPADQVIPAMQFITTSLGVDCEYCHVRDGHTMAFDKDDKKPKLTARKMIEMTSNINKSNFDGKREVTCNSCHRGAAEPLGTPIITDEEPKPAATEKKPEETQSTKLDAYQILDKYLNALGGAAAVQKITSFVEKGTLTGFGGQRIALEVYEKAPDKRVSIMHMPNGDNITAFDGRSGWLGFPGRPAHIMTAEEAVGARMDADLYLPVHLKSVRQKFAAALGEKIDGRDTIEVVGRTEGQPPLQLYFDPQSGLLLRLVRYMETPLGRLPTQVNYSDYRDANGLKIPFRWSLARPGNRFTVQVEKLEQNVPVDDAKFAPPPPASSGDQKPPAGSSR
jgi:photosynthetic reaction center cytochrome c subunit